MTATARVLPEGRLIFRGDVFRCALGVGGVRADKTEGDGATPAGLLPLRRLLYRADRVSSPESRLRREPIGPQDGWCDDPGHPDYNRQITLPHPARHERLWLDDAVYDVVIPLGWNDSPVVRGRGSAIFLHLARPDYSPTEGCVALSLLDLRRVLSLGVEALLVEGR
jgi:L,D-peptidoglycan transpeptidase YkuD (ErfK/YbiS/YcfS/YnhG family)